MSVTVGSGQSAVGSGQWAVGSGQEKQGKFVKIERAKDLIVYQNGYDLAMRIFALVKTNWGEVGRDLADSKILAFGFYKPRGWSCAGLKLRICLRFPVL